MRCVVGRLNDPSRHRRSGVEVPLWDVCTHSAQVNGARVRKIEVGS